VKAMEALRGRAAELAIEKGAEGGLVSDTGSQIIQRLAIVLIMTSLIVLADGISHSGAHQDPCHRLHSCPSDRNSYVCGDKGRCNQCPDNQLCLAGQPRPATSPSPAPAPPASMSNQSFTPAAVTVCFTSAPIAKALLDTYKRGVQVQVILEKSQRTEKYSSADFLANQGVATMIDANHAIAHNKIIIIDGAMVITGSFNFTKAAQEKNAENVLIIRDQALAAQYIENWQAHAQHSQPYVGRGVRG
jgi:PLD-like domain